MRVVVALVVIAAIAVALWRAQGERLRETFRLANSRRTAHLPTPEPLAEMEPTQKSVAGQLGFLRDLERREREARVPEPRRSPHGLRQQTIIEAEFRDISDRDSSPA